MALFIRNQGPRSELQTKVAADLQNRLKQQPNVRAEKTEPAFNENQHTTRLSGMIIAALCVIGVAVAIVVVSIA